MILGWGKNWGIVIFMGFMEVYLLYGYLYFLFISILYLIVLNVGKILFDV